MISINKSKLSFAEGITLSDRLWVMHNHCTFISYTLTQTQSLIGFPIKTTTIC